MEFEYKIIVKKAYGDAIESQKEINKLGKKGWEIISVLETSEPIIETNPITTQFDVRYYGEIQYTLKRQIIASGGGVGENPLADYRG